MTSVRVPIANLCWERLDCHGILCGAPPREVRFVSELPLDTGILFEGKEAHVVVLNAPLPPRATNSESFVRSSTYVEAVYHTEVPLSLYDKLHVSLTQTGECAMSTGRVLRSG